MKIVDARLVELQKQMKLIVKQVESGKMTSHEAAEKITDLREEMDKIRTISKPL